MSSPAAPQPAKPTTEIGQLTEAFVAGWLISRGWRLIQRRWHCRWGELDLVMERSPRQPNRLPILAFIEVKARRRGSWDHNGLLSITPKKQAKLRQSAQEFLGTFPQLAEHACRFDVALVGCQLLTPASTPPLTTEILTVPPGLPLGQAIHLHGYRLSIQHYIPGAFDQDEA